MLGAADRARSEEAPMGFEHGHALVIGVGSYPNAPALNVPQTARDAELIAEVLAQPEHCAYPPGQVRLLTESAAARAQILAELRRLARATTADSTVLIFYSGHGLYSPEGRYHLTAHDTSVDGAGLIVPESGISERELLRLAKRLPARRVLMIFNACHAGDLNPAVLGDGGPHAAQSGAGLTADLADALLGTGEGRVIITACREDQKSYLTPRSDRTIFTDALRRTLQGEGIFTNRQVITVLQLYDALFELVERTVREQWRVAQEPELTVSKGVGAMAVAHYQPRRGPAVLGPAPDVPADRARGAVRVVEPAQSAAALRRLTAPRRARPAQE
jgi:uncharacterized caspase-like protein